MTPTAPCEPAARGRSICSREPDDGATGRRKRRTAAASTGFRVCCPPAGLNPEISPTAIRHEMSGRPAPAVGSRGRWRLNPEFIVWPDERFRRSMCIRPGRRSQSASRFARQVQRLNPVSSRPRAVRWCRHLCQRVAVMYLGRVRPSSPNADELLRHPLPPTTKALCSPRAGPDPACFEAERGVLRPCGPGGAQARFQPSAGCGSFPSALQRERSIAVLPPCRVGNPPARSPTPNCVRAWAPATSRQLARIRKETMREIVFIAAACCCVAAWLEHPTARRRDPETRCMLDLINDCRGMRRPSLDVIVEQPSRRSTRAPSTPFCSDQPGERLLG